MPKKGIRLNEEQKVFIVQLLAKFDGPEDVSKAVKEQFGIEVSKQAVSHYNPNTYAGRNLAKRFVQLFEDTRKRFLEEVTDIPAANKSYRVRKLADMALRAERKGNMVLAASLLEQVAKETGNVFTNRREHTGKGGGPIKTQDVTLMTEEQIDAELKDLGYDPNVHEPPARTQ